MVWDYNYRLGPTGGTLAVLSDITDGVWIPSEGTASKRGGNIVVPSRHGVRWRPYKFYEEGIVEIRMALRYTDDTGAVTHTDGAPGHVYENHAAIKSLWNSGPTTVTLRRAMPDAGEVDLVGELIDNIVISDTQFIFAYMMRVHYPAWQSTTENSSSASPIVIAGDAQVQNASIDFSAGASSPVFTHTASGATCTYTGAVPAGGVRVYPYEDRAERISGGADESAFISFNRDYGIIFHPGSNAFSVSSGTGTVRWHDQWQIG